MTKEMFEDYLYYDETSKSCLRWKIDRVSGNGTISVKANSEAGSLNKIGYYVIILNGKTYASHRIIAVLHNLEISGKVIDHVDRDRANNKISNLRVVTQKENNQNASIASNNTSGVQGVCHHKRDAQWIATWYEEGNQKLKHFAIAKYPSPDLAFQAACEYRKEMVELHYN